MPVPAGTVYRSWISKVRLFGKIIGKKRKGLGR